MWNMAYVSSGEITVLTPYQDPVKLDEPALSIEAMFEQINRALHMPTLDVDVVYNAHFGYPESLTIVDNDKFDTDQEDFAIAVIHISPYSLWERTLNHARMLWEVAGSWSYEYTFQQSCNCPPEKMQPILIQVVNYENILEGELGDLPTILDLFDQIQRAIDEKAFDVVVTYDKTYGYPAKIYIDYSEYVTDDEYIVQAMYEDTS